ncbi:MAG: hypothetical protein KC549_17370, partial [Myxococcales bacterium]|nr:hypothetical protein [Myxococcales bacterium]
MGHGSGGGDEPGQAVFDARRLAALGRVSAVAPSPCGRALVVQVARADADTNRYRGALWRVALDGATAPRR